jgi:hypothetical protein
MDLKSKYIAKIKSFFWLLLHDHLSTKEMLITKKSTLMTALVAAFAIMAIWRLEITSFGNANSAKAAGAISM